MGLPAEGAAPDYPKPQLKSETETCSCDKCKELHGFYTCANCGGRFPLVWNYFKGEEALKALEWNPTVLVDLNYQTFCGLTIRCPHCREREYIPEEFEPMPPADASHPPKNPSTLPLKVSIKIVDASGNQTARTSCMYELGDTCDITFKKAKRPWWLAWVPTKFSQRAIVEIVREEDLPPQAFARTEEDTLEITPSSLKKGVVASE